MTQELPEPIETLARYTSPFQVVNSYGLFAVMTTERLEIVVEGSDDGQQWRAYEFPYKPGDVNRAPRWAAPYQPRLDWQMWFAALGDYRTNPWFVAFAERLLEGCSSRISLSQYLHFVTHLQLPAGMALFTQARRVRPSRWRLDASPKPTPIVTTHLRNTLSGGSVSSASSSAPGAPVSSPPTSGFPTALAGGPRACAGRRSPSSPASRLPTTRSWSKAATSAPPARYSTLSPARSA